MKLTDFCVLGFLLVSEALRWQSFKAGCLYFRDLLVNRHRAKEA